MILNHVNNPFKSSRISDGKFSKLTDTHLQRIITSKDKDQFAPLLAPTQSLYDAFKGNLNKEATGSSTKSKTYVVNQRMKEIISYISKKSGVIKDKFDKKTSTYIAFYPKGMKEYAQANKTTIEQLATRFISVAKEQADAFGPELASQCQTLLDAYLTERNKQLKGVGTKKDIASGGGALREDLAHQLYVNLLTLCLYYSKEPSRVLDFYDESFLPKTVAKKITPPAA